MIIDLLRQPWPWFVTGPLVGLVAVGLLVIGNKQFGVSSNLRHLCAACVPGDVAYFKYDWRRAGLWNLVFIAGVVLGGYLGGVLLANPHPTAITPQAHASLAALGVAGGLIFGTGWALVGACPGPLFALLGAGAGVIGVACLAAMAGTWTYGYLRPRLPH